MTIPVIQWDHKQLRILDQTLLPGACQQIPLETTEAVWQAIKKLQVRGAPAIGICAAFGVLVGYLERQPATTAEAHTVVNETAAYLATSRPTAVNLFWALDRMKEVPGRAAWPTTEALFDALEAEAVALFEEEVGACAAIGDFGVTLIQDGDGILTHCNAGGLATGKYGTALAPLFKAHENGVNIQVYADETRPLLQGARLTAWELQQASVPVTVICDNMAAQVMREGRIQLVITGADRIAANGDTANKIGTYGVAVLAKAHGIPFYIAAPRSTFDINLASGAAIPIEQRDPNEVTCGFGRRTAPEDVLVYNPAFDYTPHDLIAGFITETGIIRAPYTQAIEQLVMKNTK